MIKLAAPSKVKFLAATVFSTTQKFGAPAAAAAQNFLRLQLFLSN